MHVYTCIYPLTLRTFHSEAHDKGENSGRAGVVGGRTGGEGRGERTFHYQYVNEVIWIASVGIRDLHQQLKRGLHAQSNNRQTCTKVMNYKHIQSLQT